VTKKYRSISQELGHQIGQYVGLLGAPTPFRSGFRLGFSGGGGFGPRLRFGSMACFRCTLLLLPRRRFVVVIVITFSGVVIVVPCTFVVVFTFFVVVFTFIVVVFTFIVVVFTFIVDQRLTVSLSRSPWSILSCGEQEAVVVVGHHRRCRRQFLLRSGRCAAGAAETRAAAAAPPRRPLTRKGFVSLFMSSAPAICCFL
jgi:hypothetical protein